MQFAERIAFGSCVERLIGSRERLGGAERRGLPVVALELFESAGRGHAARLAHGETVRAEFQHRTESLPTQTITHQSVQHENGGTRSSS